MDHATDADGMPLLNVPYKTQMYLHAETNTLFLEPTKQHHGVMTAAILQQFITMNNV